MAHRDFAPEATYRHLMDSHPPSLAFDARTRTEWRSWRARLLRRLARLLGGFPDTRCDLAPEVLEREPMDGYLREKVVFDAEPAATLVAYLLIPDPPPLGERRNPADIAAGNPKSCREAFLHGVMLGRTPVGERVWDIMRCIDYMDTRPEADTSRVTLVGQSGGGTVTLFAAALEKRISAAVVSGYFCTFRDSIMAIHAPRPLLVVAGRQDPIFPIGATEKAYRRLRRVYQLLGCPEKLEKHVGEGGHRFYAERVWPFLAEVAGQAP